MKLTYVFPLLLTALLTLFFSIPACATTRDGEDIFSDFVNSFIVADTDTIVGLFEEKAQFWGTTSPEFVEDRSGIRSYFEVFFTKYPAGAVRATETNLAVRTLSESAVLVSGLWQIEIITEEITIPLRVSMLVRRKTDRWQISQFHNSLMPNYQTMDSAKVLSEHYAQQKGPIKAVENYFDYFNDADKQALNDNSDSPFIFSAGNKTTAHDKYGDSVDFDGLKDIGWAYSSINSAELVYKDDASAMVAINFSRYNTNNEAISTTDVTYMLVFKDDMWKLKAGFVQGDLSLGKK